MLVIDASVALAWLFEDERHDGALALLVARRRRRLQRDPDAMLSALRALPILVYAESALLAAKSGLSTYDAAYLELARRLHVPLATLDTGLGAAARAAGVPLAMKV